MLTRINVCAMVKISEEKQRNKLVLNVKLLIRNFFRCLNSPTSVGEFFYFIRKSRLFRRLFKVPIFHLKFQRSADIGI